MSTSTSKCLRAICSVILATTIFLLPNVARAGITGESDDDSLTAEAIAAIAAKMTRSNTGSAGHQARESSPFRTTWTNIDKTKNPCPVDVDGNQDCAITSFACTTGNAGQGFVGDQGTFAAQSGTRTDTRDNSTQSLGYRCVDTAGRPVTPEGTPIVVTVTQRDFASLPVQPARAHAGPEIGYLPVNMDLIVYAEAEAQTLDTVLLGTPVQVRATPVSYRWDFGDGSTLETANPGRPYPATDLTYRYAHQGWYDVTLTTTYAGEFSVSGGPWQDIDGTVTITSEPVAIYSKSFASRRVDMDDPAIEHETIELPPRTPENTGPPADRPQHRRE